MARQRRRARRPRRRQGARRGRGVPAARAGGAGDRRRAQIRSLSRASSFKSWELHHAPNVMSRPASAPRPDFLPAARRAGAAPVCGRPVAAAGRRARPAARHGTVPSRRRPTATARDHRRRRAAAQGGAGATADDKQWLLRRHPTGSAARVRPGAACARQGSLPARRTQRPRGSRPRDTTERKSGTRCGSTVERAAEGTPAPAEAASRDRRRARRRRRRRRRAARADADVNCRAMALPGCSAPGCSRAPASESTRRRLGEPLRRRRRRRPGDASSDLRELLLQAAAGQSVCPILERTALWVSIVATFRRCSSHSCRRTGVRGSTGAGGGSDVEVPDHCRPTLPRFRSAAWLAARAPVYRSRRGRRSRSGEPKAHTVSAARSAEASGDAWRRPPRSRRSGADLSAVAMDGDARHAGSRRRGRGGGRPAERRRGRMQSDVERREARTSRGLRRRGGARRGDSGWVAGSAISEEDQRHEQRQRFVERLQPQPTRQEAAEAAEARQASRPRVAVARAPRCNVADLIVDRHDPMIDTASSSYGVASRKTRARSPLVARFSMNEEPRSAIDPMVYVRDRAPCSAGTSRTTTCTRRTTSTVRERSVTPPATWRQWRRCGRTRSCASAATPQLFYWKTHIWSRRPRAHASPRQYGASTREVVHLHVARRVPRGVQHRVERRREYQLLPSPTGVLSRARPRGGVAGPCATRQHAPAWRGLQGVVVRRAARADALARPRSEERQMRETEASHLTALQRSGVKGADDAQPSEGRRHEPAHRSCRTMAPTTRRTRCSGAAACAAGSGPSTVKCGCVNDQSPCHEHALHTQADADGYNLGAYIHKDYDPEGARRQAEAARSAKSSSSYVPQGNTKLVPPPRARGRRVRAAKGQGAVHMAAWRVVRVVDLPRDRRQGRRRRRRRPPPPKTSPLDVGRARLGRRAPPPRPLRPPPRRCRARTAAAASGFSPPTPPVAAARDRGAAAAASKEPVGGDGCARGRRATSCIKAPGAGGPSDGSGRRAPRASNRRR